MHLCKVLVIFLFLLFAIVAYRCYVASQRHKISHRVLKNKARYDLLCNHSNSDFFMCEDNLSFSLMKISCFCEKAHLVFHLCLCNRHVFFWELC